MKISAVRRRSKKQIAADKLQAATEARDIKAKLAEYDQMK